MLFDIDHKFNIIHEHLDSSSTTNNQHLRFYHGSVKKEMPFYNASLQNYGYLFWL
jgi:hypothetical protein